MIVNDKKVLTLMCCGIFLFAGCYESLPLRADPDKIFYSYISADYDPIVSDTLMKIIVHVTNVYDETLQEQASFNGSLNIQWMRDVKYGKRVTLTKSNLQFTPKYNPGTGVVTIDPGDTINFEYLWDFKDDFGKSLPDNFPKHFSPNCLELGVITFVSQENFFITGEMNIFKQTGFETPTPINFTCCYVYGYPKDCRRPICK